MKLIHKWKITYLQDGKEEVAFWNGFGLTSNISLVSAIRSYKVLKWKDKITITKVEKWDKK